ncbi:ABC transporter permease [Paenibacillus ehimensis]|uniref:ABC transporter permease n=1 Tax=Paenibacillus ehimensis TaxID=79264 RepID=UPI000FDB4320|nr:ABC transporter permease [Paenibacillus ehimensis]
MLKKIFDVYGKYGFLLSQLVERDFKTKYRRSVLGMLWSLLNPLLIMVVQYMVFSTLFRFDIPNYSVYLLSGIVMFNYMSEATSQAMTCIIQNASLINKVYIPKYIYPFSRVLSTGVNFVLSLAALYIVIIVAGMKITYVHFALLYAILCMFVFIMGLSLLLASLMVFFRDTQFLYSIALTIWTYLTPIFYPESILPPYMISVMEFNPMYHFIRFVRFIILNGGIPDPKAWVYCALFAIISLTIGAYVFKRNQNKFILNL